MIKEFQKAATAKIKGFTEKLKRVFVFDLNLRKIVVRKEDPSEIVCIVIQVRLSSFRSS